MPNLTANLETVRRALSKVRCTCPTTAHGTPILSATCPVCEARKALRELEEADKRIAKLETQLATAHAVIGQRVEQCRSQWLLDHPQWDADTGCLMPLEHDVACGACRDLREAMNGAKRIAELEAALEDAKSNASRANDEANEYERKFYDQAERIAALEAELQTWKLRWAATRHEPPDAASPEALARDEIAAVGFAETKRRMVEARQRAAREAVAIVDRETQALEDDAADLRRRGAAANHCLAGVYATQRVAAKLREHFGLEGK